MSDCRFGVSPVNYPDPDPDGDTLCNVKTDIFILFLPLFDLCAFFVINCQESSQ